MWGGALYGGQYTLSHGSGGIQTNKLISGLFIKYFSNSIIDEMNDSAQFYFKSGRMAMTTDSFVVKPLFLRVAI